MSNFTGSDDKMCELLVLASAGQIFNLLAPIASQAPDIIEIYWQSIESVTDREPIWQNQ